MPDPDQQQMLSDFAALPDAEKQKVLSTLPAGHILKDFSALPYDEQQKILKPAPTGANIIRSDNPNVPLVTPLPGESFEDTMKRAVTMGKQVTPQQIAESRKGQGAKAATVLATAPLVGPATLTAGAIAPEAAGTAAGGCIPGAIASGATGGAGAALLTQAATGESPISKEGAIDLGKATATGAAFGGLLGAGSKLVGTIAKNAPEWWDAVTGYRKALEEAKNANLSRYRQIEQTAQEAIAEGQQKVEAVRASYPQGQEGAWAKTNEILGVPQRALRIGQNADRAYGNAGRGLEAEGLGADQLQAMKPPDQVRAITPRWQAAGKAVQGTADQATKGGTTLDGGKSAFEVLKGIKDPDLQERAVDILNQHTRELGILDVRNMTPSEALQLRQALRNDASWNSPSFDSIRGIGTKLYRAVSQDLHAAVPDLVPVDEHYGDLTTALNAAQKNTGKYLLGKWTPPLTRLQKAEAAVPELPNATPYTPLPTPDSFNRAAAGKIGWAAGLGGSMAAGWAGAQRLYALKNLLGNTPKP